MANIDWIAMDDDVGPLMCVCPACGNPAFIKVEDYSFGYEYGSQKGTHEDYEIVTTCCDAPVDEKDIV